MSGRKGSSGRLVGQLRQKPAETSSPGAPQAAASEPAAEPTAPPVAPAPIAAKMPGPAASEPATASAESEKAKPEPAASFETERPEAVNPPAAAAAVQSAKTAAARTEATLLPALAPASEVAAAPVAAATATPAEAVVPAVSFDEKLQHHIKPGTFRLVAPVARAPPAYRADQQQPQQGPCAATEAQVDEIRRIHFVEERDRVVKGNHNLRTTSEDGAFPYTIFCDNRCCLVTPEIIRHRVFFGHHFVSDDPNDPPEPVVVKLFRNVTVGDEELDALSQFHQEKPIAIRFRTVLEARVLGNDSNSDKALLVMRQCHASLRDLLADAESITNIERLQLVESLVDTMWTLHWQERLVHRDVKPSNILVKDTLKRAIDACGRRFKTKLCDFEFCVPENTKTGATFQTSDYWIHPMQVGPNAAVSHVKYDLWALALVLYEVIHCRRLAVGDDDSVPLFFNDAFPGTFAEKGVNIRKFTDRIRSQCSSDSRVTSECIPFPPGTNALLRDLMFRLMSGNNPTLNEVRDHLLLVPPNALQAGLIAICEDRTKMSQLAEGGDKKCYFGNFPQDTFAHLNAASLQTLTRNKEAQAHVPKHVKDLLNVADAVRTVRNLFAHPTAEFHVSSLYFDAPEFLVDLGVKLSKCKIRINKGDGSLGSI